MLVSSSPFGQGWGQGEPEHHRRSGMNESKPTSGDAGASAPIRGACHCGRVTFEVSRPDFAVQCNCSICRRYGALWAHCPPNHGRILTGGDRVNRYSWGDHMIEFCSCRSCGCLTHWRPGPRADQERFAVNLNMADPADLSGLRIRLFDGADSWCFLD